jgi:hypothetical protein
MLIQPVIVFMLYLQTAKPNIDFNLLNLYFHTYCMSTPKHILNLEVLTKGKIQCI